VDLSMGVGAVFDAGVVVVVFVVVVFEAVVDGTLVVVDDRDLGALVAGDFGFAFALVDLSMELEDAGVLVAVFADAPAVFDFMELPLPVVDRVGVRAAVDDDNRDDDRTELLLDRDEERLLDRDEDADDDREGELL